MIKHSIWTTAALAAALLAFADQTPPRAAAISATRFASNPLVTVNSSPTLGDNVNGPSVIRVPDWVERPLGRYYMYFAHHKGQTIRLAHADKLEGPWRIHEPGTLHVRDTAFYRELPDPPDSPAGFYTHIASPEVHIDEQRKTIVMWYHGWFTNGERWPVQGARAWAAERAYGQFTEMAESADGVSFSVRPGSVTRTSYLRRFAMNGIVYGMARLGRLLRSTAAAATFEPGPNPFAGGPYADRVRHVAVLPRGTRLHVFFSAIGDRPERILMTTIDAAGDWNSWRVAPAVEVLQPEAPYECPALPVEPSLAGDVEGPVRQLRDPAVFEESGRVWLFYSVCGEQGIAGAEVQL